MVAPSTSTDASGKAPSTRPHYAQAYLDAQKMQRVLMQDITDAATSKALRPRLVEAWDKLEDRKRILRNKPLPGSYVHEKQRASRARAQLASPLAHDVGAASPAS